MSIVRENLLTEKGYTPYCGSLEKCKGRWPRTYFTGKQFKCAACGWVSGFEDQFIRWYKEKWKIN